jgi:hypothetical protein
MQISTILLKRNNNPNNVEMNLLTNEEKYFIRKEKDEKKGRKKDV